MDPSWIPYEKALNSCSMENGGFRLDDSLVDDWITIGYDKMDGRIPACYQYSSVTTIKVMPVFED